MSRDNLAPKDREWQLLHDIESTYDEEERKKLIIKLVEEDRGFASRMLIEIWPYIQWRETKKQLLQAIGRVGDERAYQFLLKIAQQHDDYMFSSQAVLSLAGCQQMAVVFFLLDIVKDPQHVLRKEAVFALAQTKYVVCAQELKDILQEKNPVSSTLLQYVLLALGVKGCSEDVACIEAICLQEKSGPIFNAALLSLSRIGNVHSLQKIEEIPTTQRFFAAELKEVVCERIELRNRNSIEDVLIRIQTCENDEQLWNACLYLREYPYQEVWEAKQAFNKELNLLSQSMIRLLLFRKDRCDDDLNWVQENLENFQHPVLAYLLEAHQRYSGNDYISKFLQKMHIPLQLFLLENLPFKEVHAAYFLEVITKEESDRDQLRWINAFVIQSYMQNDQSENKIKIQKLLLSIYEKTTSIPVKKRLIRALGQLGCEQKKYLMILAKELKTNPKMMKDIYYALSQLRNPQAHKIINDRWKKTIHYHDQHAEIIVAIETLAKFDTIDDAPILEKLNKDLIEANRIAILKIISCCHAKDFASLVIAGIRSRHYQEQILAIAASVHYPDEDIGKALFTSLQHPNQSIMMRSLHSLCLRGVVSEHKSLMSWLQKQRSHKDIMLKFMRSIQITNEKSYGFLLKELQNWLLDKSQAFANDEVWEQGDFLKDRLISSYQPKDKRNGVSIAKSQELIKVEDVLQREIPTFSQISTTIKSVLRNAELIWQNPNLYNESVDKSTMIISLSKSIDLLLQEKIGKFLFQNRTSQKLTQLQSRIVSLHLDEKIHDLSDTIDKFECSSHFTPDDFPIVKLGQISQATISGRIVQERFRVIDGNRAWAIFILIFLRQFNFYQLKMKPIWNIGEHRNNQIKDVAQALNRLQNVRNEAAHRGVVYKNEYLIRVRKESFSLLNKIQEYFHAMPAR